MRDDRQAQELKVIQDVYDFTLWLIGLIEKFPRQHRCSLGIAMENRLQRVLELLLRAKYSRRKADYLNDANIEFMPSASVSILKKNYGDCARNCWTAHIAPAPSPPTG